MTAAPSCTDLPIGKPQALAPAAEPFAIGAHLITPRCGYTHHGIYVGNLRVVHYAGWSRAAWTRRPVEEVSLTEFAGDCGMAVLSDSPTSFAPTEVVARARSRLGEDRYRIATNNCEHFCHWCLSGQNRSVQIDRRLGWATTAMRRVGRAIRQLGAPLRPESRRPQMS
jgi:cell wall-associated NlpC family hydrolase